MSILGSLRIAVLGGLIGMSAVANASIITFSEDREFDRRSFEFSDVDASGVNLTVTSGTFSENNLTREIDFDERAIDLDTDGFGIAYTSAIDDNDEIDGKGGNDVLVFTFDSVVTLLSVTFGAVDATGDDFAFGQVTDNVFTRFSDKEDVLPAVDLSTLFSIEQLTGTSFGFGAIQSNDDFKILSINFQAAEVSAPYTGLILGLGLILVGLRSRCK